MFKIQDPTMGSDFEVGVATQTSQEVIPVTGNLGGTKEDPKPIGRNCFSQEDGPMAEFNIPPVQKEEEWYDYFDYCIQEGSAILNQAGLELKVLSSHEYTSEQLDNNDLRTLGCSSSSDAYTMQDNVPNGDMTNLRTCGLHVHLGFLDIFKNHKFEFYDACELAKYFDMFMGIPSLIIDDDSKRRELYGKAGDFRVKTLMDNETNMNIQLFEYRSLGGNLLRDEKTIKWAFKQMKEVVKNYNEKFRLPDPELLRETINTSDVETAKMLVSKYNIKVV